jgi:hypothetical protein
MLQLRADAGLSLIETAIIMTATFAIMGGLMPSITSTVRRAEETAALTAMTNIGAQVFQLITDVNYNKLTTDGAKNGPKVELVVSDGDTPELGIGDALWQQPVDLVLIDFLENHIVVNAPGGNPLNAYAPGGANSWRGAYLSGAVDPDPWGNRYAVNTLYLGNGGIDQNDVIVLSAGPDEAIDTAYTADPLAAGDDDLIVTVEP